MNDSPLPAPELSQGASPQGAAPSPSAAYQARLQELKREVARVFIGPEQVVDWLLVALLARGHILLEGVPGLAKTTLVRAFAQTVDARFRRIQFTPDMLPSDITGTYVPNLQTQEFVLRQGPLFSQIVLADEINRAPAKTQSALLEAMQERQITLEGVTHRLDEPFMVLATQNPVEQEGVYTLPEAQLDRFLLKLNMEYPTLEQELRVLQTHRTEPPVLRKFLGPQDIAQLRALTEQCFVSPELTRYIVQLVRFTREHVSVALGASPRAALALMRASQARALLRARDFVVPDDIRAMAAGVLAHRLLLKPEAELSGQRPREVVEQAIARVAYAGP